MTFRIGITVDPQNAVFVYEKKKLKAIMRAAVGEIAADARKRLKAKAGQGRIYRGSGGSAYRPYKSGRYQASAPGQSPANVTGTLLRSIKPSVFKSGQGGRVSAAFYDLFLEDGAEGGAAGAKKRRKGAPPTSGRVLVPRPTLSAALDAKEASIADRIRTSIVQDIAFKRMK